ncbi:MAG: thioredoxin-dependent thiol peroxidase [Opitutaceae bacterium]|nr:thioredoxin-dependent thiol peroxidase [Cytophagales bacterium]
MKTGDKAPSFISTDQDGKEISLEEFRGKKLAIYFYPKDDTPGCTEQACNLSDNYDALKKAGYELIGISVDDEKSHRKFADKFNLPFRLVADVDKKIVEDYGVWVEKNMYGKTYMGTARKTFIIDENGVISNIIEKVNTKEHTAQILG